MDTGAQHGGLWDKIVSALRQLAPSGRSRTERVVVRYSETLFGQVEVVDTKSRGRRPIRILSESTVIVEKLTAFVPPGLTAEMTSKILEFIFFDSCCEVILFN